MMSGPTIDPELEIEKRAKRGSERAKKSRNCSCLQPIPRETARTAQDGFAGLAEDHGARQ